MKKYFLSLILSLISLPAFAGTGAKTITAPVASSGKLVTTFSMFTAKKGAKGLPTLAFKAKGVKVADNTAFFATSYELSPTSKGLRRFAVVTTSFAKKTSTSQFNQRKEVPAATDVKLVLSPPKSKNAALDQFGLKPLEGTKKIIYSFGNGGILSDPSDSEPTQEICDDIEDGSGPPSFVNPTPGADQPTLSKPTNSFRIRAQSEKKVIKIIDDGYLDPAQGVDPLFQGFAIAERGCGIDSYSPTEIYNFVTENIDSTYFFTYCGAPVLQSNSTHTVACPFIPVQLPSVGSSAGQNFFIPLTPTDPVPTYTFMDITNGIANPTTTYPNQTLSLQTFDRAAGSPTYFRILVLYSDHTAGTPGTSIPPSPNTPLFRIEVNY